jgi:hypothetical protein
MTLPVKIAGYLGVLEYWKKTKPYSQIELAFSLLHYPTTPLLQHTTDLEKDH